VASPLNGSSGSSRPVNRSRYGAVVTAAGERRLNHVDPITAAPHLRLVWPQWQGAGSGSVGSLAAEFPFDVARRGYWVGAKVLQVVLPAHAGPTAVVPVEMGDVGLEERDGIEAKAVVLQQLRQRVGDRLRAWTCAYYDGWRGVFGKHGAVLVSDQRVRC
jgi:hypothetical protein